MTTANYIKKEEVCQCRKCGKVFNQSKVKRIQTQRYGLNNEERVSPCCEHTYGVIDYPVPEEELIYKNGKFYTYNGKHIKQRLDKYEREE